MSRHQACFCRLVGLVAWGLSGCQSDVAEALKQAEKPGGNQDEMTAEGEWGDAVERDQALLAPVEDASTPASMREAGGRPIEAGQAPSADPASRSTTIVGQPEELVDAAALEPSDGGGESLPRDGGHWLAGMDAGGPDSGPSEAGVGGQTTDPELDDWSGARPPGLEECASDSDEDGVADCDDECPTDPSQVVQGICGCGGTDPLCESLFRELRHRYGLGGESTELVDSLSELSGIVVNTTVNHSGQLELAGMQQYGEIPVDAFSGLGDFTIEAWIYWQGVLDRDEPVLYVGAAEGDDYLLLTPDAIGDEFGLTANLIVSGEVVARASSELPLPRLTPCQVAVVFDESSQLLRLYLEGERVGEGRFSQSVEEFEPEVFWLGRTADLSGPTFRGLYDEVRVYRSALADALVNLSFELGQNVELGH